MLQVQKKKRYIKFFKKKAYVGLSVPLKPIIHKRLACFFSLILHKRRAWFFQKSSLHSLWSYCAFALKRS